MMTAAAQQIDAIDLCLQEDKELLSMCSDGAYQDSSAAGNGVKRNWRNSQGTLL